MIDLRHFDVVKTAISSILHITTFKDLLCIPISLADVSLPGKPHKPPTTSAKTGLAPWVPVGPAHISLPATTKVDRGPVEPGTHPQLQVFSPVPFLSVLQCCDNF